MAIDEAEKKIENGTRETTTRGRQFVDKCLRVMSTHAKEICFVVTVLFTLYAALHSGPLKTQKVPTPNRFFPTDSLVTDYYLGSIHNAFEKIAESDLTFVMYYATWDATSMIARWEFDKTANYFHNEIQFLAINCWWPEGECRQHFRKIQSYPVLMAYPGIGRGIQYRGPHNSAFMFRFLEKLRNPLQRVFNLGDLINLQVIHDTVVVAYFDFESERQPAGFEAYYHTALKSLERDSTQKICFAVATEKKVASLIGLANTKDVILLEFNQSVEYKRTEVKEKVLSWTYKERQPVAQWLNLPMAKSLLLSNVLEKSSPALILFTPQNPVVDFNLYFNLLKEVAMDYFNCNDSDYVRELIAHSTYLGSRQRSRIGQTDADCEKFNKNFMFNHKLRDPASNKNNLQCCYSVAMQLNSSLPFASSRCEICATQTSSFVHKKCDLETHKILKYLNNTEKLSSCKEFQLNYSPNSKWIVCCVNEVVNTHISDDNIAKVVHEYKDFECKKQMVAHLYGQLDAPHLDKDGIGIRSISGLGCRTNRSLSFAALDSNRFEVLANNVGVDLNTFEHRTAVLIHHTQEEGQFLMHGQISKNALKEFIWNFTDNQLQRHLKTDFVKDGVCDEGGICVVEVTSSNFVDVILKSERDVILLYYTHWCGFCLGIFHTFLQAAFYFKNVPDLMFARINGDANDLPWEYTVENYPTILFFPAGRKIESQAFPDNLPVTLSNLISFVLANAGLSNRLLMAMKLCSNNVCVRKNRHMINSHIQSLLADIRELMVRLNQVESSVRKRKTKTNLMDDYKKFLMNQLEIKQMELKHSKRLNLMIIRSDGNFSHEECAWISKWQQEFIKNYVNNGKKDNE